MTISTSVLMLLIVVLAVKMKGAQIPHVILGMLLLKSVAPGSIIDEITGVALDALQSVITQIAEALGQSGVV